MANRHLSRSVVLQTLYEWDFQDLSLKEVPDALTRNLKEFAPGTDDNKFIEALLSGVLEKQNDLDVVIEKAAPDWPLDKISVIDRNILRLGLFELLFADRDEVPPKVAINEAIELAKNFGGETSSKFINGVLGAVYKEIGEPGKDQQTKRKVQKDIPVEEKAGAVVFARDGEEVYVGLVHDVFGHWTLPKGGAKEGEQIKETAARKVKDEIGVDAKVTEELGNNEYIAHHPEKGKIKKRVVYFLAEAKYTPLTLGETGGLDDAQWFKLKDIVDLNFYPDILPIVTKAINMLV